MMSKIVNLAHIKQPLPDVAAPPEKKRIAWDGGKISTNKDQAVLSFLKKKKERGEQLTDAQREILARSLSISATENMIIGEVSFRIRLNKYTMT